MVYQISYTPTREQDLTKKLQLRERILTKISYSLRFPQWWHSLRRCVGTPHWTTWPKLPERCCRTPHRSARCWLTSTV